MEFFQVIKKRYSHKAAFSDESVPEEDLRQIVEAGMAAPSAGNGQSPEFIIVNDPEIIEKLGEITQNDVLQTAPALVVILTRPRVRETLDTSTECLIADFAVATENILLAATALGYCCGWLDSPFTDDEIREKAHTVLHIPGDRLLALAVPIGHPGKEGPRREKKPFGQRASINQYQIAR